MRRRGQKLRLMASENMVNEPLIRAYEAMMEAIADITTPKSTNQPGMMA